MPQVVAEIAKYVGHLVSFQRNPQYSVPSGQGPVTPEYRQHINDNYPEIWRKAKDETLFAFGFQEVSRPTFSVDERERKEIYETAWRRGGGFRFMFETFGDISTDEAANHEASNFIKAKICETVKDPEKARKLLPTQLYARRPLCDAGYYEQFNRDNVELVSLQETPIAEITPKGIKTADGQEYQLDVIIFATGFDAVDGNYTRVAIQGRNGETLKDHWRSIGPTSYLGVSVPNFPNLFMILGPNGPFCNLPPAIETQVEFISDTIEAAERSRGRTVKGLGDRPSQPPSDGTNGDAEAYVNGQDSATTNGDSNGTSGSSPVIEATPKAEADWTDECDKLSAGSLFRKTDSWIFGSNVPGKKHAVMFYFAGLSSYRNVLRDVIQNGWKGFTVT